jgi:hypothetical protein
MDRLQKILFLCFLCIIVSMIKHYKCGCLVLQNITIGGKSIEKCSKACKTKGMVMDLVSCIISLMCCFIILFSKY